MVYEKVLCVVFGRFEGVAVEVGGGGERLLSKIGSLMS